MTEGLADDGPRTAQTLGEGNGRLAARSVADGSLAWEPSAPPLDLLLSFAFHPKLDHRHLHSRLPPGSLLWIDSGAFTAYTTGAKLTREQYAEHLEANRGGYDYAFSLDVIGDPHASRANTEWLWGKGFKVVPVFHFGSSLSEWRSLCREYGYLAAGGLVPLTTDRTRVQKYLRHLTRIADEHGAAVHALGTAGRQMVINTRVWSADSSAVSSAPLYGNVPIYDRRRKRLQVLRAADTAGLYRHRADLLHYGFPLDTIMRERKWTSAVRPAMFRAGLLSVADMWADVRRDHPAPAPERLWAPEGERPPGPGSTHPGDGPRPAYALGPGNSDGPERALDGPRVSHSLADSSNRIDAALGPRTASALTKGEAAGALAGSTFTPTTEERPA